MCSKCKDGWISARVDLEDEKRRCPFCNPVVDPKILKVDRNKICPTCRGTKLEVVSKLEGVGKQERLCSNCGGFGRV